MGTTSATTGHLPGHPQPAAGSGGVKPQMLWHAVRRHPIVVMLVALLAGAVAAAAWLFLPLPKLTGVAVFRISSQPPALLAPVAESKVEFATYKTMQAALMKQRLVLNSALNRQEAKDLPTVNREPDRLAYLERNLNVDFKLGPEFMRVTIEGDNEEELQNILKAVGSSYLAEVDRMENGARDKRRTELEKRRTAYEGAISAYQARLTGLATILQSTNPAVLAVMEELAKGRLQQLQQDILKTERDLEQAKQDSEFFREKAKHAGEVAVPDGEIDRLVERDEGVLTREKDLALKRIELEDLDKQLRDKTHPKLAAVRKAVADAEAELTRYRTEIRPKVAESLKEKLTHDQAALAAGNADRAEKLAKTKEALYDALDKIKQEIGTKSLTYIDLEKVRQSIARTEKWHDQIVLELDQLELERGAPLRVTQYEAPYVASGIEGNRRLKAALAAAGGTLVIGLIGLVFWESRNRRILAVDDVGKALGLKVFGTVPPVFPTADGPVSAGREAALAEAIDTARTMLLYGTYGGAPKTVLVTSATPGEGKTSLTGHLAISLARVGYRTLLIDADLRNPSNHRIFDVPASPGLCELLRGEADLAAAVRPTPFPGLSVLPGGAWTLAATQALAGDRWTAVRAAVEAEYDFVVIDSAPILPVVDSLLLARNVDGVILSVLRDHSRVASVAESQHRLMSIGANLLGVVLNGIEPNGGRYGYASYGYAVRAADPVVATTA